MKRTGRRIPARHRSRRAPPRRPGAKRTSTRKHRQKRNTPGESWERPGRNWCLTYHYEADGCHGDCRAEKLAYLTSGGDLEQPESLGVLYWKQLCAMFGIPAFSYVFAGGLDLDPAKTEEILTEACEKARRLAEDF